MNPPSAVPWQAENAALVVAGSCYFTATRAASAVITRRYETAMERLGMTIHQFSALAAVATLGPEAWASRVAGVLGLDRSTVSRDLGHLKRRGLLLETPAKGRRALLSLSPAGRARFQSAFEVWTGVQAELDVALTPAWRASVMSAPDRVRAGDGNQPR